MEMISLLGMLGITSFEDARKKEVHSVILLAFAIFGMTCHLVFQRLSIYEIIGGFLIGFIMLLICFFTQEEVGMGDGILLMVTGIYLGFQWNLLLLIMSIFLMGGYCMVGIATHKLHGRQRIAFFPFVLVSYIALLFMTGGAMFE